MDTKMSGRFTGKVAFVSGAGSDTGRATARAFAREGASVVVASRFQEHNQQTVREHDLSIYDDAVGVA